ncbi:Asp-tRNA(Asn)/Glu-tRNA(Gln) amidotransferase subunit GatC [Patescibacteria group bacterium]|nr:Asp-tRNA(Asn)/Glu-tRNA(Gln) amidotransferase subunit GatC [Patescibacteria group bacterium]
MKLPKAEVEHIAMLARIGLTEAEKQHYSDQLSAILEYVDELKKVDIKDVPDVGQITGLENQSAKDTVKGCELSREELFKNAPMTERGYIKVKSVLGRET